MALEEYLQSLVQDGEAGERGEFTLAPERAKALLAGKALPDVWAAWTCLAQGFISLGASSLELSSSRRSTIWKVGFQDPKPLVELLRDDRFLLGWLNLGWFGTPRWHAGDSLLEVPWHGNVWKRYRMGAAFPEVLDKALKYAPIAVKLGIHSVPDRFVPSWVTVCLYPTPPGRPGGIVLSDGRAEVKGFQERRRFALPGFSSSDLGFDGPSMAAYAYRSKNSWSEVTWVSQGVVIQTERNTLDRPRINVVASVQAAGLQTDISGLAVVNNQEYFDFRALLKSSVVWML